MTKHLTAIRHLSLEEIQELLRLAADFKHRVLEDKPVPEIKNKVLGMLFFEDSTRTRVSFEQAANFLKLKTANFASSSSSMNKGETLKDTILTLRHERLSGLVMRHRQSGAPVLAAKHFGGPVINAGDGSHEHPTQALGDAMTILERKGRLDGLKIAIVGDVIHSRVARSNFWLLSKAGAEVRFVGPRTLVPESTTYLAAEVYHELTLGLDGVDVVMALRLQKERMLDGMLSSVHEYAKMYQINREALSYAKPDALVMHPGPLNRGVEMDDFTADGGSSVISNQVENGVFVRMAALYWAFDQSGKDHPKPAAKKEAVKS